LVNSEGPVGMCPQC